MEPVPFVKTCPLPGNSHFLSDGESRMPHSKGGSPNFIAEIDPLMC